MCSLPSDCPRSCRIGCRPRLGWAILALLGATLTPRPRPATAECAPLAGVVVRGMAECDYGGPAASGRHLLLPRLCRLQQGAAWVWRQTVEIRDLASGALQGQASLPAVVAPPSGPDPNVAQVIGGAWPLLVHDGGVAAVDVVGRSVAEVFAASGRLQGVAVLGETLALVEAVAPDTAFPNGALEWTVLDFGQSEILGSLRLAPATVTLLAIEAREAGREAVLGLAAGGRFWSLRAPVRVAAAQAAGELRPRVTAAAAQAPVQPTASCPVVDEGAAALPASPPLVISSRPGRLALPGAGATTPGAPGAPCLALFRLGGEVRYGWYRDAPTRFVLRRVSCAVRSEPAAPPTTPAPARGRP